MKTRKPRQKRISIDGMTVTQLDNFIARLCGLQGKKLEETVDMVLRSNFQLVAAVDAGLDALCQNALIKRDYLRYKKSNGGEYDKASSKQRLQALRLVLGIGPLSGT